MKHLVLALLLAAGTDGGARAQDVTDSTRANDLPITLSRAVAGTHNCSDFYPEWSRRRNESGDVLIRYDVAADGRITNVGLVRSSGFAALDNAAVACVAQRWRNAAASRGGLPIASVAHQAIIRFSLHDTPGAMPMQDRGVFGIVMAVLGTFVAALALLALYWALERRKLAAALRRTCANCGMVDAVTDRRYPANFCARCGHALPPS